MKTMWMMLLGGLLAMSLMAGCDNTDEETTVEGEGGQMLTLAAPGDLTLSRGEIGEVPIRLTREGLTEAVAIEFEDLPQGVSVVNEDRNIVGDEATFRLQVADDAALVANQQVKVTAKAPEADVAVTETFLLTIQQPGE